MDKTIDATGKKYGRLASEVAKILNGKTSVNYEFNRVPTQRVIVKNVDKIVITEKKLSQKIYYHHTGYMGHMREKKFGEKMAASPAKSFRFTVEHMLPKNRSRKLKMRKLIIE